jgi:hypothetical protein
MSAAKLVFSVPYIPVLDLRGSPACMCYFADHDHLLAIFAARPVEFLTASVNPLSLEPELGR